MKFVPIGEILKGEHTGKKVAIRGWVHRERKQKAVSFFLLRDDSGIVQTAIKPESKYWDESQKLTIESSAAIEGTVKEDKRAPGGYEISVDKLEVVGVAERYPITKDQSEEFLRDVRHLWIRSRKMTLVLKIRAAVFEAVHEFYKQKGYFEIQSPSFTGSACEGGSTLFEVKYFDQKAYLTQSWQLYAEAMIFSLQKIYCIAPSYRAEKSRTRRHLAEYWHHEMETAWMGFEELMGFEEEMITFIAHYVAEKCETDLKELGRDVEALKKFKGPFIRMRYEEAIKILGQKWGYDLTDEDERKLVADAGKPIFLTHFPREMKAFYMKVDQKDRRVVLGADLLMPGVGETIGGSERISDSKELEDSLKLFKLKKEDYSWYMDLRKYGTVPHSGFGLGMERLVMWLASAEHIMDTIPFPRTMTRLYP
ncbi:MAG: asparagine--tRNA ligase [Candidatus Nanoarchaeia archaeon]|nr:asparagine--tRNA ligase [Candidatus Nanoarchaeia archaeon]